MVVSGLIGAIVLALNIPISKYAYIPFLINSVTSMMISYRTAWAFFIVSSIYMIINVIGVTRWIF